MPNLIIGRRIDPELTRAMKFARSRRVGACGRLPKSSGADTSDLRDIMKLLTEEEAAAFLRCSRKTLYRMRCQETGPKWMRIGQDGGIRYPEHWLEQYVEAQARGKNESL